MTGPPKIPHSSQNAADLVSIVFGFGLSKCAGHGEAGLGIAPDALPLALELTGEVLSGPMGPQLAKLGIQAVMEEIKNVV